MKKSNYMATRNNLTIYGVCVFITGFKILLFSCILKRTTNKIISAW